MTDSDRTGLSQPLSRSDQAEFDLLKLELPRIRRLAKAAQTAEASQLSPTAQTHFLNELRWCIEALQEFQIRVKTEVGRH
ncbi:MAG TPA: hypothetical protein VG942_06010 [Hyphomonadaceae bacterium]|nr:hypothetical protein [Hyphomonadaceae bacterium]